MRIHALAALVSAVLFLPATASGASPGAADRLLGTEISADRASLHPNGEVYVIRGEIRRTPSGAAYLPILLVPVDADVSNVVSLANAGLDLDDMAAVTLLEETGPVTIDLDAATSLDVLFGRAVEAPLPASMGGATLSAQWEYEQGRRARVDVLRLVPATDDSWAFPYAIPTDSVPLVDLFRDFFWRASNRLAVGDPVTNVHWAQFLDELGIERGTAAEAALVRASLAYEQAATSPEENEARREILTPLLDDEPGYMAKLSEWESAQAVREGRIVRTLRDELASAGASLDGILSYLETTIRPKASGATDKPDGDSSLSRESGAQFCRAAGITCPSDGGAR